MFQIIYCIRVDDAHRNGVEGTYKTELVAKRHLRRLKRKYPETKFKIKSLNKREDFRNESLC